MIRKLEDYREFVDESVISDIFRKASEVSGYHVLHVNSSYYGGGIVEILRNIVPLMNEIGVDIGWRAMVGSPDFFRVTKKFHNALHGDRINLTNMKKMVYEGTNEDFASFTHIDHDLVIVHDIPPLPLIKFYDKHQPWIWRFHTGLSNPRDEVWDYLKSFALPYNLGVFQTEDMGENYPGDYRVMNPSIDPLSDKNKDIDKETIELNVSKAGLDTSRPIISQISPLDKHMDPFGVLEVFKHIRNEMDCQLALIGAIARDDPEGQEIYEQLRKETKDMEDVSLIIDPYDIVINSIQRASDVVLQKSLEEGFGLSVSEALWKRTPVVGSTRGGIIKQIDDGGNGYLVDPVNYTKVAEKVMEILSDENLQEEMGRKGKEKVRKNFLITRHIDDWLDIISKNLSER